MSEFHSPNFSDEDVKEDIARRVLYWRTQANMSKSDLAKRSGKTRGEITRWEKGEVTPGIASAHRLATACGVSLSIFLTADIPQEATCQE